MHPRGNVMEQARTARDYMSADPVTLMPETDTHLAMRTLVGSGISGAPVVDGRGDLVGLLTEKDCFRFMFAATYHREQGGWVAEFMGRGGHRRCGADLPR
jgi:CBS domain-containing protein